MKSFQSIKADILRAGFSIFNLDDGREVCISEDFSEEEEYLVDVDGEDYDYVPTLKKAYSVVTYYNRGDYKWA